MDKKIIRKLFNKDNPDERCNQLRAKLAVEVF